MKSIDKELAISNNGFNLEFTFMPSSDALNQEKIFSEGYSLEYGKK